MSKLQEKRKEKGLTQKELAEKAAVSLGLLQKYETGERDIKKASYENVKKLANALKCQTEDIV